MSTCPDKSLYSVYVDGELLSPWKEKIELHLCSCPRCQNIVDSYKKVSVKLSDSSAPNLNLEDSFSRLYAKRQECLSTMETSQKRCMSWLYKSVKIPVPALVAAAIFLFVCTPAVILGTKNNLKPSDSLSSYSFHPIVPTGNNVNLNKKFILNVSNIFGLTEKEKSYEDRKQEINLSQYVNLYLPPAKRTKLEFDILNQKRGSLFSNDKNPITVTFLKNGK